MKKGFTLLELVVVIIILGVLATLGFTQYGRMVERARGAEARQVLGDMRKLAYAYYLANGSLTGIQQSALNVGSDEDQLPGPDGWNCRGTHYFAYRGEGGSGSRIALMAMRCTSGGKTPQAVYDSWLKLTCDFATGSDSWEMTASW